MRPLTQGVVAALCVCVVFAVLFLPGVIAQAESTVIQDSPANLVSSVLAALYTNVTHINEVVTTVSNKKWTYSHSTAAVHMPDLHQLQSQPIQIEEVRITAEFFESCVSGTCNPSACGVVLAASNDTSVPGLAAESALTVPDQFTVFPGANLIGVFGESGADIPNKPVSFNIPRQTWMEMELVLRRNGTCTGTVVAAGGNASLTWHSDIIADVLSSPKLVGDPIVEFAFMNECDVEFTGQAPGLRQTQWRYETVELVFSSPAIVPIAQPTACSSAGGEDGAWPCFSSVTCEHFRFEGGTLDVPVVSQQACQLSCDKLPQCVAVAFNSVAQTCSHSFSCLPSLFKPAPDTQSVLIKPKFFNVVRAISPISWTIDITRSDRPSIVFAKLANNQRQFWSDVADEGWRQFGFELGTVRVGEPIWSSRAYNITSVHASLPAGGRAVSLLGPHYTHLLADPTKIDFELAQPATIIVAEQAASIACLGWDRPTWLKSDQSCLTMRNFWPGYESNSSWQCVSRTFPAGPVSIPMCAGIIPGMFIQPISEFLTPDSSNVDFKQWCSFRD